jgi:MoxR-like ATPase
MGMDINKLKSDIEKILNGSTRIEIDINDPKISPIFAEIQKARNRNLLTNEGIVFTFPKNGDTILIISRMTGKGNTPVPAPSNLEKENKVPTSIPIPKRHQHTYVVPKIAEDMMAIICDDASHVVWLTGPTQCGKDRLVHYIGRETGRKTFQINCRGDMGSEVFFGEKTVKIDEVTKQNMVVFQKGLVEQAMTEGLDEQGNEVGPPGILFITEAASMPAHVAIGINRLLESDDVRRTLVIDQDGGRVVRSHSKFRIVLAANTVGRGAMNLEASAYSAQTDALDISLINRIAVCFRMGYDREVERHILLEKIGDDAVVAKILKFRDAIRDHIKQGKLSSPLSTAHLVHVADMYRIFGDLAKAIYYVTFEFLMPEEKAVYNEQVLVITGKEPLSLFQTKGVDYM